MASSPADQVAAWFQPSCLSAATWQVNENAKKDLKEGLLLYNTENNLGLKNAWNIIQAEVRGWGSSADWTQRGLGQAGRWGGGLDLRLHPGD